MMAGPGATLPPASGVKSATRCKNIRETRMRKLTAAVLIELLLIVSILASCGAAPRARKIGPADYTVGKPQVTYVSESEAAVVFERDDKKIEGKIVFPEGEGPYPAVVMVTGLYALYPEYERKARGFTEQGYAAVLFNFVSNADANSDKVVKDQDVTGLLRSQVMDLAAVLDSLSEVEKLDTARVFLWGHSYGGLVSAYVACRRQDDIRGMMLAEPSLDKAAMPLVPGDESTTVDIYKDLEQCRINTVIFVGTESGAGEDPHAYEAEAAAMPGGKVIRIEGADHLFAGEYGDKIVEESLKFIRSRE